jgi:DNA polymerase I
MAQIPAIHSPYGKECRSLFGPPEGWMQVGCDASGLELRCLAHYMSAYDGGAYANVILTGDIHTENQKAAGLETRDQAKRFIYAFLKQ